MNILLSNKFFYLKGGSERVFFQERDYLLEQGINVIDFSMDDPRNFPSDHSNFFVSSIDYHNSSSIWKRFKQAAKFIHSFEAINNIKRLIHHENIDIAHLHNIYHQLTPSIIALLKKKGAKVVLTLHDGKLICPAYTMLNQGEICTACHGKYFWRAFFKNCQNSRRQSTLLMIEALFHKWKGSYDFVDLFIAPSNFMADLISQRIPEKKIYVLRNGVDINKFSPTYGDEGYGLYFGRLSKEKGVETFLKAHKILKNLIPIKIVGTGPIEDKLKLSFPMAEFSGYRKGKELKEIIAHSAFVVVPSEWNENCSMVVLEAMAMGKAVLGSRVGGIPEQVDDGETGFLFEMGDEDDLAQKMYLLSEDRELRIKMGQKGREKVVSMYNLDNHCKDIISIYENLLQKNIAEEGVL